MCRKQGFQGAAFRERVTSLVPCKVLYNVRHSRNVVSLNMLSLRGLKAFTATEMGVVNAVLKPSKKRNKTNKLYPNDIIRDADRF